MRVAIIGGGPAGLTAAYLLASNGIETDIYETSPSIGGLAKTIYILNEQVEFGPHFLRSSFFNMLAKKIPTLQKIKYSEFPRKTPGIRSVTNVKDFMSSLLGSRYIPFR